MTREYHRKVRQMANALHASELAFIEAFIAEERRERYRMLLANPRRRREILDRLNHVLLDDLRADVRREPLTGATAEGLSKRLWSQGAPDTVHLISDDGSLDGRDMPLGDALRDLLTTDWGAVACCSNRLAVYRPEAPQNAYLLIRER
jgi:hypothetical protein